MKITLPKQLLIIATALTAIFTFFVFPRESFAMTITCYNNDNVPFDCTCNQSAACLDGVCSCTMDGVPGWEGYCSECVDNYQTCESYFGFYEIRWCGGGTGPSTCTLPSNLPDSPLSCDGRPGSFNETNGFVYKQRAWVRTDPSSDLDTHQWYLTKIGFTCSPFGTSSTCTNDTSWQLTTAISFEGYFQADEDAYYQFSTWFTPVASVAIDVNGNGTIDDSGNSYGYPYSYWTVLYGHCCNDKDQCSACYPPLQAWPGWEGEWDWRVSPLLSQYYTDPYYWTSRINPSTLEAGVNGPKTSEVLLAGVNAYGGWPAQTAYAYSNSVRYLTKGPHKIIVSYWNNQMPSPTLKLSYRKLSVPALLQRPDTDFPVYNSSIKPLGVSKSDYINTALVRNNGWYYANKPDWIPFTSDCNTLNAAAGVDRLITVCAENTLITGTLFDASQNTCSTIASAPKISGAGVTATNIATGQTYNSYSNSSGVYKMGVGDNSEYNFRFQTGELYDSQPLYACDGTTASFIDAGLNQTNTITRNFGFLPAAKNPWFQVIDSDVSSAGNISSKIPRSCSGVACSPYFDLKGEGGFPGVVAYKGSADFGVGEVSEKGWLALTTSPNTKIRKASYYMNNIPSGAKVETVPLSSIEGSYFASGGTPHNGYYWYMYNGDDNAGADLTITSDLSLGERKVVLMVKNANLNIAGNINLTKGKGFFLSITTGDIKVASSLGGGSYNLEGIYIADGVFDTGTGGTKSDSQLKVRGSVVGFSGVTLSRDLGDTGNATNPAEVFEYAPDQELLFPLELAYRAVNWREVAP